MLNSWSWDNFQQNCNSNSFLESEKVTLPKVKEYFPQYSAKWLQLLRLQPGIVRKEKSKENCQAKMKTFPCHPPVVTSSRAATQTNLFRKNFFAAAFCHFSALWFMGSPFALPPAGILTIFFSAGKFSTMKI